MNIFVTILVLIVMLGILISSHEAGHLAMAKAFGVYCEEYSVGFGPKFFSHRRKGGETAFSLRVIPLGGYVAMYSEQAIDEQKKERQELVKNGDSLPFGVEVDEDVYVTEEGKKIPRERALESKKWWQRLIILFAGIAVNLLLSFLFVFIYATCFPQYIDTQLSKSNTQLAINNTDGQSTTHIYNYGDGGNSKLFFMLTKGDGETGNVITNNFYAEIEEEGKTEKKFIYTPSMVMSKNMSQYYYLDGSAKYISGEDEYDVVVLCDMGRQGRTQSIYERLCIFPVYEEGSKPLEIGNEYKELGITYLPDLSVDPVSHLEGDVLKFSPKISTFKEDNAINIAPTAVELKYEAEGKISANKQITTYSFEHWGTFSERASNSGKLWVNFFKLIGEGFGKLFQFNMENIGGIVAMGKGVSTLNSQLGVAKTFFFYGGFISLNLGLFNLLPFPGLDGWGMLVTVVESIWTFGARAIFKFKNKEESIEEVRKKVAPKKIPAKAKNIVSLIGFGLLAAFAIFVTVKDIMRFIG